MRCSKCGCTLDEAAARGAYFERTSPKGGPFEGACAPSCTGQRRTIWCSYHGGSAPLLGSGIRVVMNRRRKVCRACKESIDASKKRGINT